MITNRNNFPEFTHRKLEILSESRLLDMVDKTSFLTENYFYCSILLNYGNEVNLSEFFKNAEVQSTINQENTYLLVASEWEPTPEIIDIIYNQLIKTKLVDAEKIVLISENKDISLYIQKIAASYNLPSISKIYWVCQHEFSIALHTRKNKDYMEARKYGKITDKTFLILNRRWRPHRPLLVALLKQYGLLDKGLVSLAKADDEGSWDKIYNTLLELVKSDQELFDIFKNNETSVKSIPYMSLDTDNFLGNFGPLIPLNCDKDALSKIYADTIVSVVTESLFFEDFGRFISEKTFKCFAYKHPLIMLGPANTLPILVERGYKTFHPYIDETYDSIYDPLERLKAVINEIKRITEFTDYERNEFVRNISPIVEHNFNVIAEKRLKNAIHE